MALMWKGVTRAGRRAVSRQWYQIQKAVEDKILRSSAAGKGHALCIQSFDKVREVGNMILCNYD